MTAHQPRAETAPPTGRNPGLQHPDPAQGAAAHDRAGQNPHVRLRGDALRQAHVGHGMSLISFDVIRRYLEHRGLRGAARPELHRHRRQDHQPRQRGADRPRRADGALHRGVARRDARPQCLARRRITRGRRRRSAQIIAMVQGLIDRGPRLRGRRRRLLSGALVRGLRQARRTATSTICSREPASRSTSGKRTRSTSRSGKPPNRASRAGSRHGAPADPAGTSNARR